jgi:hypothetical protein
VFPSWWADRFGQTPPLGYRLRLAFPDRWLRIHSLPRAKRYPSDAHELELLLERHAAVAAELVGADPDCRILTATYGERVDIGTRRVFAELGARTLECFATMPGDEEHGPEMETSYWVAPSPWDGAAERPVLIEIAEDRLRAAWLAPASGEVYAPYDGGADLILADASRRDALADRYRAWLSARPDGL